MAIPKEITRGLTATWKDSFADYSAATWTLTYHFRGASAGKDVVATADGADFVVNMLPAMTDDFAAGVYSFDAVVDDGTNKFLVASGFVNVRAGLSLVATNVPVETRTANQIILDKVRAMTSGSMDKNVQEYTINNRQLKHYTLTDLIELEKYYAQKVAQEFENAEGRKSPFLRPRAYYHVKN